LKLGFHNSKVILLHTPFLKKNKINHHKCTTLKDIGAILVIHLPKHKEIEAPIGRTPLDHPLDFKER
jgi:hypothetical protein